MEIRTSKQSKKVWGIFDISIAEYRHYAMKILKANFYNFLDWPNKNSVRSNYRRNWSKLEKTHDKMNVRELITNGWTMNYVNSLDWLNVDSSKMDSISTHKEHQIFIFTKKNKTIFRSRVQIQLLFSYKICLYLISKLMKHQRVIVGSCRELSTEAALNLNNNFKKCDSRANGELI